jgi:hypothetical protein
LPAAPKALRESASGETVIPASKLSTLPYPIEPLPALAASLPPPPTGDGWTISLTVDIDDLGRVLRVEAQNPLSDQVAQALQMSIGRIAFAPGTVNGAPVKTEIVYRASIVGGRITLVPTTDG